MTPEEKLYTLMALAEDLQAHAQILQAHAKTALEKLDRQISILQDFAGLKERGYGRFSRNNGLFQPL